ncbi:MAG TPA: UDP-N-acetylmuramoylalanyl-D-glutamyl-2,6-diaminopimelate--D-alanyl-D-alanine ligase [Hyphomicrobiaceae bacterium]|jgi:UDP-N-acetylmuramoyl-tripeptide--D-alanyl-D-alanine ligase|nr:UDP-N-acetylmuramoylalanyl-D-glutamyl-2,6-diaminopimelate--D-alanyl-D-alanine ligase [Hyphomicrobiaceae bacterium]
MSEPLWQWADLVAAAQGAPEGEPAGDVTGFSIDTRSLAAGEVFVALKDARDGHEFVPAAFAAGAVAAIVARGYQAKKEHGTLLRVDDPLGALEAIGRAARARSNGRIVAVTGSVGKTGTKEMLRQCLAVAGATHAAEKSYNNHWGVPLSLARLPRDSAFGVFEIGMNHPGEITPLTLMVRPHVAVITTVEPVHLGQFPSVEAIAEAKAEIFQGLVPGGTAVLPRDNAHFALLRERASAVGARIVTFGYHDEADFRALQADLGPKSSSVIAGRGSQRFPYTIGAPGEHYVRNSLAVLATLSAVGADPMRCLPALARISAPVGRGARTVFDLPDGQILLIDESYNANPASVRAALAAMATTPRDAFPRRVAVLGDMLELGDASAELHRGLKEAIDAAGIDLVLACGPMMRLLLDDLAPERRAWAPTSAELEAALLGVVRAGDVVMIKGSLGTRMAPLVAAMVARFGPGRPGG